MNNEHKGGCRSAPPTCIHFSKITTTIQTVGLFPTPQQRSKPLCNPFLTLAARQAVGGTPDRLALASLDRDASRSSRFRGRLRRTLTLHLSIIKVTYWLLPGYYRNAKKTKSNNSKANRYNNNTHYQKTSLMNLQMFTKTILPTVLFITTDEREKIYKNPHGSSCN